jgi:CheY-like chemotaxis protein
MGEELLGLPAYLAGLTAVAVARLGPAGQITAANPGIRALTGFGRPADRRRAREAGFDAHLVKPLDLNEPQRVLARVAERPAP